MLSICCKASCGTLVYVKFSQKCLLEKVRCFKGLESKSFPTQGGLQSLLPGGLCSRGLGGSALQGVPSAAGLRRAPRTPAPFAGSPQRGWLAACSEGPGSFCRESPAQLLAVRSEGPGPFTRHACLALLVLLMDQALLAASPLPASRGLCWSSFLQDGYCRCLSHGS